MAFSEIKRAEHFAFDAILPRRRYVLRNALADANISAQAGGSICRKERTDGSAALRASAASKLDAYGVFIYQPKKERTDGGHHNAAAASLSLAASPLAASNADIKPSVAKPLSAAPAIPAPDTLMPAASATATRPTAAAPVFRASYVRGDTDKTFASLLMFCFIGALISGYLFYRSFYRIAANSAKPIAYVTAKTRIAQRKFFDRMSWDRIGQNSAIYNGDTIHTGALSEVTVSFIDGTMVDLYDNTMVQVFLNEKGQTSADLTAGSAKVDASTAEDNGGFNLASGGVSVTVAAGSSVAASKTDDGGTLQVVKGTASVEDAEGGVQNLQAGEVSSHGGIIMTSPLPNEKLIYYSEGSYSANFQWQCDAAGSMAVLEVASDKKYKDVISRIKTDTNEADVRLSPNRYYWRIKNEGQDKWLEGKFTVVQSLPPKAVTPVPDCLYSYRTRQPAIRLMWTETALATEYKVSVSTDPGMANPIIEQTTQQTSLVLPPSGDGVYYWQVAALLSGNALSESSQTRSFRVERKLSLLAPALYMPQDKAAVNIEARKEDGKKTDAVSNRVNFSWKSDAEADAYHIKVYSDAKLNTCVIDKMTSSNLYAADVSSFAPDTQYWWCVSVVDGEGNESEKSEVRTFTALDGIVEQRLIEPADGYTVSDSLTGELKFAWKKSVPHGMTTHFEVSKDENFDNIIIDTTEYGLTKGDVRLNAGSYYWRIRTLDAANKEDAFTLETPARKLIVVPPFPPVKVTAPMGKAIATWNAPYKFIWKDIEGAELYRIAIFDKSTGAEIYSDTVYAAEADIDMYRDETFKHRTLYRYEIQGRLNDNPGIASRRSGLLSEGDFTFVRLQPVMILNPKNGDALDGIDSLINGVEVRYKSIDPLGQVQVVLSSIRGKEKSVLLIKDTMENPLRINISEGLKEGLYELAVNAKTTDGIDVSSSLKERTRFSVLPIPQLSSASSFAPSTDVIDGKYLKEQGGILVLSWDDVPGATDYDVSITSGAKEVANSRVSSGGMDGAHSYTLDIMALDDEKRALFASGEFECTVTPYRMLGGIAVQNGKTSKAQFRSAIAEPKKSITLEAVNPYSVRK